MSTPADIEAGPSLQLDPASTHTPAAEQGGLTAPAAEEVQASVAAFVERFADLGAEPALLLGLPPMVQIGLGHVPRDAVFEAAAGLAELDYDGWHAEPEDLRARAAQLALACLRHSSAVSIEIRALFALKAEGLVEVTAKSRDGKPYRRAGHVWTADFQTLPVAADLVLRIRQDPGLLVKG